MVGKMYNSLKADHVTG